MHDTGYFPDCYLLSVTDRSIWIPYLARYSEIFKKPNFQVVKWKSTFIWKMLSQAELETDGSRLATIFGLPLTPPHSTSLLTYAIKVGLGISRTNADYQWNPVDNTFHRFFVVETKRFVSSFVNLTLTRQTCNQRSSRAAESKRRVLGNYFSQQICYMFLISKCRRDWGPGLAQLRYLRKEHCCAMLNSDFFCRRNTFFFRKSSLRSGSLFASTEVVHRPGSQSPLHFDIRNI